MGTLRFYWDAKLSKHAQAAVEEAIRLAYARSACTCEICGNIGRLYSRRGWLMTLCSEHAKGDPVPVKPSSENVHIVWGMVDGRVGMLSCRR